MEQKPQPVPPRRRLTAAEVRNKYGTGTILLLAWEIWCIHDGWFHPDPHYEYVGFSRFMAYISFPVLAFCIVMAGSAMRALQRRKDHADQGKVSNPTDAQS